MHKTFLIVAAAIVISMMSGCAHAQFTLPVTRSDAQAVYPALLSVAKSEGHQAWLNDGSNLQVELKNGTHYWWYTQNDGTIGLAIKLAKEPNPNDVAEAKATADALWQRALEARAQYAPVQSGPPAAVQECRMGSDGSRTCGFNCRLGSDGHYYCAQTPEGRCHLNSNGSYSCGQDCQLQAGGFHACF